MNPLVELFKLRKCKRCKSTYKPTTGTQVYCSSCKKPAAKERQRRWAKENRERLNQKSREWYLAHVERSREIKRKWNWTHREQHGAHRYVAVLTPETRKKISGRTQAKRIARRAGIEKVCSVGVDCIGRIELHHLDKNPLNNELTNLRYLCKFHHMDCHRKPLPDK